jgi:hypothetical protein
MKIQISLKSDNNTGTLHEDRYTILSHLSQFFLELKTFHTKVVEKNQSTDFMFNIFFRK